jgi:hypothetical protein
MQTMSVQTIPIDKIRIDGGTQQRPLDQDALAEYTHRVVDGSKPPAVEVVFDGKKYWMWDGFHRYHAHVAAGQKCIAVNVRKGTQREAVWLSFSANKSHGVRRQKGVVREIIEAILADPEWQKRKDTEIAAHVGVTRSYVNEIKTGRYSQKLETQRAHTSLRTEPEQKSAQSQEGAHTSVRDATGEPAHADLIRERLELAPNEPSLDVAPREGLSVGDWYCSEITRLLLVRATEAWRRGGFESWGEYCKKQCERSAEEVDRAIGFSIEMARDLAAHFERERAEASPTN